MNLEIRRRTHNELIADDYRVSGTPGVVGDGAEGADDLSIVSCAYGLEAILGYNVQPYNHKARETGQRLENEKIRSTNGAPQMCNSSSVVLNERATLRRFQVFMGTEYGCLHFTSQIRDIHYIYVLHSPP